MEHYATSPGSFSQEAEESRTQVCLIPEAEHLTTEYQPLSVMRAVRAPVAFLCDDKFADLSSSGCELLEGRDVSESGLSPWSLGQCPDVGRLSPCLLPQPGYS